jgi:DMSO/TMAO reductase YedYZ molybdopterin-dependent catalytic subunit
MSTESDEDEREACVSMEHGFFLRPPPPPHKLQDFITDDHDLFQTIHMGTPTVDPTRWRLKVCGLVEEPLLLDLAQLHHGFPTVTITAFHECYGSPLHPPTTAVRRIGNVHWTGVRLRDVLARARPSPAARYVWSDGLDRGTFADVTTDRYRKDVPLAKATRPECLLAFGINGHALDARRGGPVRLVIPGWYGTNSTKWISRLSLQPDRSPGPFTTRFYNEVGPDDDDDGGGAARPVWGVEPNSVVVGPAPGERFVGCPRADVRVWGWAWCEEGVGVVELSVDGGAGWTPCALVGRVQWEWQRFEGRVTLGPGAHAVLARATGLGLARQPLSGRRNHSHSVVVYVDGPALADTDPTR